MLDLVDEEDRAAVRDALTVTVYTAPAGPWTPGLLATNGDSQLGLLLLEGLLLRDVSVAHTTCGELVGAGELLRPWDRFGDRAPMPVEIDWKALEPLRIAILDHHFAARLGRWPTLVHAFMQRAIERSHSLALHVAIHCIRRVDVSLLVLFAHLADRFGKVTPEGVVIPVRLNQEDLGRLVGATRQSVNLALRQLFDRAALARRDDETWILNIDALAGIDHLLARRSPRGSVS
ncbi:MAG TPA: helix-turn-helix domain-containing protein [Solirubrobacteraceae bacterium]|nr:helix-turn-helix domain-containing protein [Solirubrobacteraceae bacterium]